MKQVYELEANYIGYTQLQPQLTLFIHSGKDALEAERDLRGAKVKQKVSVRCQGVILTHVYKPLYVRKQGHNTSLRNLFYPHSTISISL